MSHFPFLEHLSSDHLLSHRFGDPIELPCDRIHIPTILLGLLHDVPAPIPVLLSGEVCLRLEDCPGADRGFL